jgi:hypothetical protein
MPLGEVSCDPHDAARLPSGRKGKKRGEGDTYVSLRFNLNALLGEQKVIGLAVMSPV